MEFLRDRASLGWNLLFPLVMVAGLAIIFGGPPRPLFKVAVIGAGDPVQVDAHPFLGTRYAEFYALPATERDAAVAKVGRHRLDMLLDLQQPPRYWVNPESPKGYVLERLLRAAGGATLEPGAVPGRPIRYIDFLLPGILGMNMMFSCLWGVGYVVVRYRKSGFLKRLNATPVRPIEFILAQLSSRLLLIMGITLAVYVGTDWVIGFRMEGSHALLALMATLGALSMIAMGFVVAAFVTSEELAGGILNFLSWPMMLLSGVWFSMEGSQPWLQQLAQVFPLTHLVGGARAIMLDGAGMADVTPQLLTLAVMTLAFLGIGARIFRWRAD
ncbi:MAG TPA: ABC transporter permease [Gammaproteobacteria bacterium]|nr:ABC transporter permease [Gammaproteobacteria bacterium]HCZ49185.1 ABC transporter permease [Gammaproteobacteria bacterium]MCH78623.1 ABC transporter permease [Gammaproteobacteria bacterium]